MKPHDQIVTLYHDLWTQLAQLLNDVSESDWSRPAHDTKWTVGEVLSHLLHYPNDMRGSIGIIKSGHGYGWIPKGFLDWGNYYAVRSMARKQSLQNLREEVKTAEQRCLQQLAGLPDELWSRPPLKTPFGEFDLLGILASFANEVDVHSQQVRAVLGAPAAH